jgi:hypothetical protein
MYRLNKEDLKVMVCEAIEKILMEAPYSPFPEGSKEWKEWVLKTYTPSTTIYWKAKHPEWSDENCQNEAKKHSNKH